MAHCLNWDSWDLGIALISWGEGHPPPPRRGTLTPFIPLFLRAIKGEGEIRIEGHVRAEHACAVFVDAFLGRKYLTPG